MGISKDQQTEMYRFMGCIGQLIVHSVDLQSSTPESLAPAIVWLTLKYFKNTYKYQLLLNTHQELDSQSVNMDGQMEQEQIKANQLFAAFKYFLK